MIRMPRKCTLALAFTYLTMSTLDIASARAAGGDIRLTVDGFRNDTGEIRGALFASPNGWTERGHEVAACRAEIHAGRATCTFRDVPAGEYAIAFLHDEDGNGDLARNFLGIPEEGFGFSNDAPPSFGPASFRDASVAHDGSASSLRAHVRYGL